MKSHQQRIFIFLLFIVFSVSVNAQKLTLNQLGIQQGLPATEVYNLFQDKQGYVWAFTEYGIVKHNGNTFIPVCENIEYKERAVYAVAQTKEGLMYFANSKAHIYKIINDSAILITGFEKATETILIENDVIFSLTIDEADNLFISTFKRSFEYLHKEKKAINAIEKFDVAGFTFKESSNNYTLVKSTNLNKKNYFFTLLNKNDSIVYKQKIDFDPTERNIIRKYNNNIFVTSAKSILMLNEKGLVKKIEFDKGIINFEIAPNGLVWVGLHNGGLIELDDELNYVDHYLNEVTVSDILFDDQSGMWISTIGEGIYYCKNIYNLSYYNINELVDCISMLKVIGKKLFIGTSNGNLYIKEGKKINKVNLNNNKSYINDIIVFENKYYIGTKNYILIADTNFKKIHTPKQVYNAYSFSKTNEDTLVIVSGSVIIKKAKYIEDYTPFNILQKPRFITKRFEKEFFISTGEGLYTLNTNNNILPNIAELKTKNISRLKTDKKNNIWICTKGNGLYKLLPNNKLIQIQNTPSIVLNDISFVHDSIVLLSTNKGAYVNTLNKLNEKSSWLLLFDEEILSLQAYGGKLFIATKKGLTTINANRIFNTINQKFYLKSVVVNNKTINPTNINLNYKQNNIYFNFDFLAYQFPDKKIFFELQGPTATKGIANGTQLYLQNLSPGHYVLKTYPLINLTDTKKTIITTLIFIKPAFWQTNTFLFLFYLTALATVTFTIWFVFYRRRKKEERKTEITKQLTEHRLTALKAQINPHFISNSLSAIQQLIITDQIDKANQYMAKFSMLIRYVLKFSDKSVANLNSEIKIIDLNIELEQLRFSDRFIYEKIIDDNVDVEDIFIPPLITQPFIENAIWHGLLPLKDNRTPKLTLKIIIENDKLIISIIDNGVGRKIENKTVSKNDFDRESKGTWLIKNRIENLNNLYLTNGAQIDFVDLIDEHNMSLGTQVNIVFPLDMLDKLYDEKNKEHYY